MKLLIEQKLAQEIADYLDSKPHKEVRRLIDGLLQCKPQEEAKDADNRKNEN